MQGSLSLQQRLVMLVVAAILPLSALSVWSSVRAMQSATRAAQSQLKFSASLVAAEQDQMVASSQQLLSAIATLPGLLAIGSQRCASYFEDLRGRYPVYSNIGLLDLQGNAICHANHRAGSLSVGDRPYFRTALAERRFVMSEAVSARLSGRWVIPFAQPVFQDGKVAAVVFLSLDLAHAAAALASSELPEGASVTVADRRGRVLMAHPRRGDAVTGVSLPQTSQPATERELGSGVGELTDAAGQARIYAFATSSTVAGNGFVAQVSMDRAQVTGATSAKLRQELLVLAITLLSGMAAAWWIGGRAIVRPAQQILRVVHRLELGQLDARVPLQGAGGGSEFERIAAAFNLMADSLQIRQKDVATELGRSHSAYAVLDTVLNSLQEGLIAVNRMGLFLMFNQAATRVFALQAANVLPQDWPGHFGMFEPDGQTLYEANALPLARALRGESGSCLVYVKNEVVPEGRMLQCHYQPLQEEGGIGGGLMVFADVTDLRKAEAELMLLRNPLARLNDIVLITEAEPIDHPGPRIVFVNEVFERLTGYTAQEAIGKTPRMLQGPKTDRAALDRIRAALAQWQPVREELVNYTKCGEEVYVEIDIVPLADEKGRYTHWISVQRNITARRNAEQALKASQRELQEVNAGLESRIAERTADLTRQEQLYRTLAEQAPEVVWNSDASGTKLTFLNHAWYELLGGRPEDWIGQSGSVAIHPDDRVEVAANWQRSSQQLSNFTGVRRLRDKYGSYHTMSYKAAPVLDGEGQVAFWVGIDSDITELKAIESALRSSNEELEAFSYSVSHDLRAPLGAIGGFSRALGDKLQGQLDPRASHYLARIQAGVEKMEQLIEALLSLAKVVSAPLNFGPVDLTALARETLEGLQMQQPDRKVVARVEEGLATQGDARLLRGVLENLLGNAWKFTSQRQQAHIEMGKLPDSSVFFIRDDGVGFDMANASKLFGAFQRLHTEAEFPGTGIGLATVQRVVVRHQGRVWAQSELGQGATFFFTFSESPPLRRAGDGAFYRGRG